MTVFGARAPPAPGAQANENRGAKSVLSLIFVWFSYLRPKLSVNAWFTRQSSVTKRL
jgi:hypothetical protein